MILREFVKISVKGQRAGYPTGKPLSGLYPSAHKWEFVKVEKMDSSSISEWTVIHGIHGSKYLYEVNRDIFRAESPSTIYTNQYKDKLSQKDTLYILIGTDSGLLPAYVYNHGDTPKGTQYVFIETPEILSALEKSNLPLPSDDSIHIITIDELDSTLQEIDIERYMYTERVILRRSISAMNGHIVDYTSIWLEIDGYINEKETLVAPLLVTKGFIRNEFKNLTENVTPSSIIANSFTGYTAVILAGGTSLDQSLSWVKESRSKLFVIAVSRISRRLIEHGIVPDIIIGIDPNPAMFDVSRDMLTIPAGDTPVFLHSSYVNSRLLKQWPGKSLYIGHRARWKPDLDKNNIEVTPPTVTNAAVTAAIVMRFSRILLCGVDLCYSHEGHTHASGSIESELGPNLHEITVTVETNGGQNAQTNNIYRQAGQVLENQAKVAKELNITIINTARNAMRINGINYVAPNDLAIPNPAEDPKLKLSAHIGELSRHDRTKHYALTLSELLKLEAEVNKIKDLAKKAIEYNQTLYTKDGKIRNHKNKIKLDKIEKKINSNTSVSRFVKMYGIRDFLRTVRPKGKQWTPTEANRWTMSYYQAFIESCTEILECISDTKLDIETHINEERSAPDFDLVSLYLINQNIPGRINVIRQKNPVGHQYIVDNYPEHVEHIKNLFEAQLTNSTLLVTKHFESNDSSKLLFRIRWLFGKHDTDGLYKLASHLETKTNDDKNLAHLARGLGLELHDRLDEAASEYQKVAAGAGLEDALVHLSQLLIERGDTDNAILALECLTHLSPIYMPQHAELLYLTGNVHGALDEYANYFEIVPDDIRSLLKLADIYEKHNARDAAVMLYKHVMTIDPSNETAISKLDIYKKL